MRVLWSILYLTLSIGAVIYSCPSIFKFFGIQYDHYAMYMFWFIAVVIFSALIPKETNVFSGLDQI